MELTQEEIQANIEKLRNKVGDARTGGKGSQRRKVKVVSKVAVIVGLCRLEAIRSSRPLSRRWERILSASMRSTSSGMTTPSSTSRTQKVHTTSLSLRVHPEQHLHRQRRARDQDRQGPPPRHHPAARTQTAQAAPGPRLQHLPISRRRAQPRVIDRDHPSPKPRLSGVTMIEGLNSI